MFSEPDISAPDVISIPCITMYVKFVLECNKIVKQAWAELSQT